MTMIEILVGALIILAIFFVGVFVGTYINRPSQAGGRHRRLSAAQAALPPSEHRIKFDERQHISQQGLDDFRRGMAESMEKTDFSRIELLRDYVDEATANLPGEERDLSPEDVAQLKIDLEQAADSHTRHEVLRQYYDSHSTAEEMENGHWEGLSGSLEPEPEPKVLRPEETSSSLLGLSQGDIRPTGGLKPVFGETEHLKYDPEDYEEPLICQPCKRTLVKGETFWAVSLPEEGEGVFIPICDDCEAKSHG